MIAYFYNEISLNQIEIKSNRLLFGIFAFPQATILP